MNLLERFQQYWQKNFFHLSPVNSHLLLAVSGGIDSVVMTELIFQSGFNFFIAHCNFQLREEESQRDENFVRSLEEKYDRKVFIKKFDTKQYATEKKLSIQEAARELRYNWFSELINSRRVLRTNFIATAHHADDNIETMMMFFFRGTGIQGLTGIPAYDKDRKIIRPLLFATREEISAYAKENSLEWVEDSSNVSDKYTRNFFRNEIVPAIAKHFPQVKDNLVSNLHRFTEVQQLYQQAIQLHKKKLIEVKGNEVHIPVLKLQHAEPLDTILWEIIKEYNFHSHQVKEVTKLLTAENSSYVQSQSHRIIKNRNWLIIAPNAHEESEYILIEAGTRNIRFKNGNLDIETIVNPNFSQSPVNKPSRFASGQETSNFTAQLDARHIEFPLLLRKWKQGDYFYPLGMQNLPASPSRSFGRSKAGRRGKKKLSRFFIDQKLSKTEKENVWVIEMNKKIVWVIGYRIDDRFKITDSTKEILKISFKPA